jgi:hypothetical protein
MKVEEGTMKISLNKVKIIALVVVMISLLSLTCLTNTLFAQRSKPHLAPDGSWIGGNPHLAPDGSWVGGKPVMTPDGTWVGIPEQE